jgi:hypothetical protein
MSQDVIRFTSWQGLQDKDGAEKSLPWDAFAAKLATHRVGKREGSLFSFAIHDGTRSKESVRLRTGAALDVEPQWKPEHAAEAFRKKLKAVVIDGTIVDRETGELIDPSWLVIPPPPEEVARRVKDQGWRCAVYTTHNHHPLLPRYRVVLMYAEPVAFQHVRDVEAESAVVPGLALALGLGDVVDRSKFSAESIFFLPRHADGAPFFAVSLPGSALTPDDVAYARAAGAQWKKDRETPRQEAPKGKAAPSAESVVAEFNRRTAIDDLLSRYGYKRERSGSPNWRSPNQTTDSFATRVYPSGRWISLSGSDAAAGLGKPAPGGSAVSGDAFDLFAFYECSNDFAAAVKRAAADMGMTKRPDVEWGDNHGAAEPPPDTGASQGADGRKDGDADEFSDNPSANIRRARIVTLGELFAWREANPIRWLVDGVIKSGLLYTLVGSPGGGKTTVACRLAMSLAAGVSFAKHETEQCQILYVAAENQDGVADRFRALAKLPAFGSVDLAGAIDVLMTQDASGLEGVRLAIAERVEASAPYDLIVVDTAQATFPGDNENDNTQQLQFFRWLRGLTYTKGNPTVLVLAHPAKGAKSKESLVPRGAGSVLGEIDGNFTVTPREEGGAEFHWAYKLRGENFDPIPFDFKGVDVPEFRDTKGRPSRTVIAEFVAPEEARRAEIKGKKLREALLVAMLHRRRAKQPGFETIAEAAYAAGALFVRTRPPEGTDDYNAWKRAETALRALRKAGHVSKEDTGPFILTTKGRELAEQMQGAQAQPARDDVDWENNEE